LGGGGPPVFSGPPLKRGLGGGGGGSTQISARRPQTPPKLENLSRGGVGWDGGGTTTEIL